MPPPDLASACPRATAINVALLFNQAAVLREALAPNRNDWVDKVYPECHETNWNPQ